MVGREMFCSLAQRRLVLVLDEFAALADNHREQVIKTGNEQDPDHCSQQHSANGGGTNRPVGDRPGAGSPE